MWAKYIKHPNIMVLFLILSVGTGCSFQSPQGQHQVGLVATVKASANPNTVEVEFQNGTSAAVNVERYTLESSVIVLEVIDSNGLVIPPVPPSIPPNDPEHVSIPPEGRRKLIYNLQHFSPPLLPGKYRVRVKLEGWISNYFEYEVPARQ